MHIACTGPVTNGVATVMCAVGTWRIVPSIRRHARVCPVSWSSVTRERRTITVEQPVSRRTMTGFDPTVPFARGIVRWSEVEWQASAITGRWSPQVVQLATNALHWCDAEGSGRKQSGQSGRLWARQVRVSGGNGWAGGVNTKQSEHSDDGRPCARQVGIDGSNGWTGGRVNGRRCGWNAVVPR